MDKYYDQQLADHLLRVSEEQAEPEMFFCPTCQKFYSDSGKFQQQPFDWTDKTCPECEKYHKEHNQFTVAEIAVVALAMRRYFDDAPDHVLPEIISAYEKINNEFQHFHENIAEMKSDINYKQNQ